MPKHCILLLFLYATAICSWAYSLDEPRILMPPANLQLSSLTATSVRLSWNEVPYRSDNPYLVHRKSGDGAFGIVDVTYTPEFIDANLQPDTDYQWCISIKGLWGVSDSSRVLSFSTNNTNLEPTELQCEAIALKKICLSWQDNSPNETGVEIQRRSNGGDYAPIAIVEPNAVCYIDSSFAPNTHHHYRLRAIADSLYSAYSNEDSCVIDSASWAASGFKSKLVKDYFPPSLQMQLSWQNTSLVAEAFVVERKINEGQFIPIETIYANGLTEKDIDKSELRLPWLDLLSTQYYSRWDGLADHALDNFSYTDKGLSPNTAYSYRIRAMADSSYSLPTEELRWQLMPSEWAPKSLWTYPQSPTSIQLLWSAGIAGDSFEVYCKQDSSDYSLLDTVNTNIYIHRALSHSTRYTYTVIAKFAEHYSTYSPELQWKFDPESWKPHNLKAEVCAESSIRLKWEDLCSFEEGIAIERKTDRGEFSEIGRVSTNLVEFIDSELSYGLNYTYRIRAFAENLFSPYSAEICVPLIVEPASRLNTTTLTPNSLSLVWQDNCSFEDGFIIQRRINAGDYVVIDTVAANIRHYLDKDLKLENEYTYQVKTFAGDKCSSYNPEIKWVYADNGFVLVPQGSIQLGNKQISIAAFYLDRYELEQAAFQGVMGYNPSHNLTGKNRPVESVSWFEAIEYCNRRSKLEGLEPCYSCGSWGTDPQDWPKNWKATEQISCNWQANGFRLPTEAEWEYAASEASAKPSKGLKHSKGSAWYLDELDKYAWHINNSGSVSHAAGTRKANKIGLFDMLGNVWEWVWEDFVDSTASVQDNPPQAKISSRKVIRGGSMSASREKCQVDFRDFMNIENKKKNVGFRVCRNSQ